MAYAGKILKINLSTGKSEVEPLNRKWAETISAVKAWPLNICMKRSPQGLILYP